MSYECDRNSMYYYFDDYVDYTESDSSYDDQNYVNYCHCPNSKLDTRTASYISSRNYISAGDSSNYYMVARDNLVDDIYHVPSYVVPVVFTPARIVTYAPGKLRQIDNSTTIVQENVDKYYSNRRNVEREANIFHKLVRETIPEESGSNSTLYVESPRYYGSDSDISDICKCSDDQSVLETSSFCHLKSEKSKQYKTCKSKSENRKRDNLTPTLKTSKRNIGLEKRRTKGAKAAQHGGNKSTSITLKTIMVKHKQPNQIKEKSDNVTEKQSWVTMDTVSSKDNKEKPTQNLPKISYIPKPLSQNMENNLHENKLLSKKNYPISETGRIIVQRLHLNHQKSDTPNDSTVQQERAKYPALNYITTIDEEREQEDRENQKIKYHSICDMSQELSSFTSGVNKSEIIGWKNKRMQQESSENMISELSNTAVDLGNGKSFNSIDTTSTDVTIGTEEYEEFMASIVTKTVESEPTAKTLDKLTNDSFQTQKSVKSSDFDYDANSPISELESSESTLNKIDTSTETIEKIIARGTHIEVKTLSMNHNTSSDTLQELLQRELHNLKIEISKNQPPEKVNPLIETPLSFSAKNLRRNVVIRDDSSILDSDDSSSATTPAGRTWYMKVFRYIGCFVSTIQNFSYRYFLRYILFI